MVWYAQRRNPLLHDKQIIVFLSALNKQVFAVDKVVGSNGAVGSGKLFLVQRHASALHQLTHFALASEHGHVFACKKVDGRLAKQSLI